ncbi:MAG: outer membrane beta-barrel protein [Cyclobacteriaceae bacterium]
MKIKTSLLIILAVLSYKGFSQFHFIGLKSGLATTNVTSDNSFLGDKNKKNINFGLTYEYQLSKKSFIGIDLLYTQKGFINVYELTNNSGNTIGTEETKFNYNYLSLPVKYGLGIANKVHASIYLGLAPSLLQSAEITSSNSSSNIKSTVDNLDIVGLIEGNIGYEFLFRTIGYASFSFNKSFLSADDFNTQHYGFNFL